MQHRALLMSRNLSLAKHHFRKVGGRCSDKKWRENRRDLSLANQLNPAYKFPAKAGSVSVSEKAIKPGLGASSCASEAGNALALYSALLVPSKGNGRSRRAALPPGWHRTLVPRPNRMNRGGRRAFGRNFQGAIGDRLLLTPWKGEGRLASTAAAAAALAIFSLMGNVLANSHGSGRLFVGKASFGQNFAWQIFHIVRLRMIIN